MRRERRARTARAAWFTVWLLANIALFCGWLLLTDRSEGIYDTLFGTALGLLFVGAASTVLWVFLLVDFLHR